MNHRNTDNGEALGAGKIVARYTLGHTLTNPHYDNTSQLYDKPEPTLEQRARRAEGETYKIDHDAKFYKG